MIKRLSLALTSAVLFTALVAMPAAADPPVESTDSVMFPDVNPCSGLIHQVTIDFEIRLHQHQNRVVVHIGRTGSTDSGYRMDHGVLNAQNNGNVAKQTFSDIWSRDDGSKFKAQGTFVLDLSNNAARVDRFSIRCIQP
jgi:hypothetical protein